jgi:hypothetical protein
MGKNGVFLSEQGFLRPHPKGERQEDTIALLRQVYQLDGRLAVVLSPDHLQSHVSVTNGKVTKVSSMTSSRFEQGLHVLCRAKVE